MTYLTYDRSHDVVPMTHDDFFVARVSFKTASPLKSTVLHLHRNQWQAAIYTLFFFVRVTKIFVRENCTNLNVHTEHVGSNWTYCSTFLRT